MLYCSTSLRYVELQYIFLHEKVKLEFLICYRCTKITTKVLFATLKQAVAAPLIVMASFNIFFNITVIQSCLYKTTAPNSQCGKLFY